MISFNDPLNFFVSNNNVQNSQDFKLTKFNASLPQIREEKFYTFSFTAISKKRKKKQLNGPIETVIVRG